MVLFRNTNIPDVAEDETAHTGHAALEQRQGCNLLMFHSNRCVVRFVTVARGSIGMLNELLLHEPHGWLPGALLNGWRLGLYAGREDGMGGERQQWLILM